MAADGKCERSVARKMNEGHKAWGALKSVHSNRGLWINANKCTCLYDGLTVPKPLNHRVDSVIKSSFGSKIMHLFIRAEISVR